MRRVQPARQAPAPPKSPETMVRAGHHQRFSLADLPSQAALIKAKQQSPRLSLADLPSHTAIASAVANKRLSLASPRPRTLSVTNPPPVPKSPPPIRAAGRPGYNDQLLLSGLTRGASTYNYARSTGPPPEVPADRQPYGSLPPAPPPKVSSSTPHARSAALYQLDNPPELNLSTHPGLRAGSNPSSSGREMPSAIPSSPFPGLTPPPISSLPPPLGIPGLVPPPIPSSLPPPLVKKQG